MMSVRRLAATLMVCCAAGVLIWLAWPSGGVPASGSGPAVASSGLTSESAWLSSSLAVPGVDAVDGDQQALDVERARRASASAFFARQRSRTEFAHLGAVAAARVAREAFPALIDQRDGGAPALPAGERLRRFTAENVAQISLPDHERGVVESIVPMALRNASGKFEPIDLALKDQGASFTPTASQVAVQIPKRLGGGVRAPGSGVSLTPADGKGGALNGSEGSVDGASVLYANTQTDTDTLAKPTSRGFDLSAILRAEASPHELYYRLGLPSGASLVQHQRHSPVQVVKGGVTIGMVMPPTAVDAAGTPVPVTMAVNGDLLTVDVQDVSGEYQYPLQVDPEYVTGKDRSLTGGVWPVEHPKEGETNWVPMFSSAFSVEHSYKKQYGLGGNPEWYEQAWYIEPNNAYNAVEFAGLRYRTQGQSTIYNLEMTVEGENEPSQTATAVEYRYNEGKNEGEEEGEDNHLTLSEGTHQTRYEYKPLSLTSGYFSNPLETPRNNDVRLIDYTTQHEYAYGFWTWMYNAQVYVAQEESKRPELESTSACPQCGFNKSSSTIAVAGGRANVLYGSGTWLSPYQGAFEATAHDPGIGVSFAGFTGTVGYHPHWIRNEEGKCLGIQCPETYSDWMTYNASMPNGEDETEFFAEDAAGLFEDTYAYPRIKVDASKPYNLGFTGMPEFGAEISAVPRKLTVHATDGKKPTPSSGIRSVSVSLDGGTSSEISGASCSPGECTASGEYTLDAESLSEGVHRLVVSVVSNSGEPEAKEFTFDVRHASPVSVGPASVDPTTGQLTLAASDVSLGGASGVSRSYQSRNLTAGASGPFGPQWAMSVGGGEELVVLPTGSVSLVSGSGGRTTFALNSKSEFESPKGDESLKMEYKASEHKYVLKDEKAGAETVFEQPAVASQTPTFASQFGPGTDLGDPENAAIDAKGNVWVADTTNSRIVEFSQEGTLIASYGSYGSEGGEMINPWGIAINQSSGAVYVTDQTNNRVDEFSSSGAFVRTFGSYGTGEGQVKVEAGVAVDASGNVWVADYGNNRIEEFNAEGTFEKAFGAEGSGNGQFKGPLNIAFSGGNLYVTDSGNDRVEEFSSAGAYISQWGSAGSGNGQFNSPRGIAADPSGNLYVAELGNDRVQEFTSAGKYVTKFGTPGSGLGQLSEASGVAVSSSGAIYVTDYGKSRVEEWARSTWVPTSATGSLSKSTSYLYGAIEGSEGNTLIVPAEVLTPTAVGVSCGTKPEELKEEKDKGCHALTFKYATATTATGENPTQWGEYMGRLIQVSFHAWNATTKAMEEKAVAQYSYDKQGRLRAEWDPRVEASTACGKTCAALKTTYGYDSEGHVTALTPPGQQPWAFLYGTIAGDANAGRLLKVTRAQPKAGASEEEVKARLKEQAEQPTKTEAPKFSGTAVVGVKMGVSTGVWGKSPVVYAYEWEDCNVEGKACAPILGATNANYTVSSSDVGHTLLAVVTATNGGGSVSASPTTATSVVSTSGTKTEGTSYAPQPGATIEFRVPVSGSGAPYTLSKEEVEKWGQKDTNEYEDNDPVEGTAVFAPDEPQSWPASNPKYTRATVDYINSKGLSVNSATPTGGIATTEYNELNEAVRTLNADNRAAAMKEGCKSVAKKECKSAEVSEKLDTKSEYNAFGNEIVKVVGPEHKVKLATGEEVAARAVTHNYYDENAKQAEEKNKETYNLITKTTSAALLASGEEKDTRTNTISYNGQEDLGWRLRKPTSTTTDPAGLDLVHKTLYSAATGDVIETTTPASNAEVVYPPVYQTAFGSAGSAGGQFSHPQGEAVDASGNLWVIDAGNNRVEKFSSSGTFIAAYGSAGSGSGQFSNPAAVAINQGTGNVYVTDGGNHRLVELNSVGGFVEAIGWGVSDGKAELEVCKLVCKAGIAGAGNGQLSEPSGLTLDSQGDIWVVDAGNDRVEEFSSAGAYLSEFASKGSGNGQLSEPIGIAISEGEFYVVDYGNDRVEEFSSTGGYLAQFASKGSGQGQLNYPVLIAANATSGDLYVSDAGNSRIEEFTPAGKFLTEFGTYGSGNGQLNKPTGVAVSSTGTLYISDQENNRISEWLPQGAGGARMIYSSQFGSAGSGNGQFNYATADAVDGHGNLWVSDFLNNRVQEFSTTGKFIAAYGSSGSGHGQFAGTTGIAVNQSTGNVYVGDCGNHRIEELSSSSEYVTAFGSAGSEPGQMGCPGGVKVDASGNVWIADGEHNRIEEFSATGSFIAAYGTAGSGEGQFEKPSDIAFSGGNLYVVDSGNHRVEELSTAGKYLGQFGSYGGGDGEFYEPESIAADPAGNLYVDDASNGRVEEFSASGTFLARFASKGSGEGQLSGPIGIAINAAGSMYVVDSGNSRVEEWISANEAAHNTKTIYYTAKEEAEVTTCRNRPEWVGLVCQVQPVSQPDRGLPELPITTVALYNLWGEAEKTEEKFGTGSKAVTRTKTETYDPAGRAVTSEVKEEKEGKESSNDAHLPKVTDEYNAETGAVEKQSTSEGTITSKDNTLGQLTEYKDASGNVAKYTYEEGSDGRLEEFSEGKGEEAKSTETYSYNTTTGFMEKLVDTAVGMTVAQGTFTASYDVEGKMTSETYPNNMTASYTINSVGQTTGLVYEKNADCASKCPETWFGDSVVPSIHGETLQQASTLAKENYAYDAAGRLLETQETPTGKGCVERLYAYEEESNRTSETTREPGTEGKCATEGGTVERHAYDEANRLADEGIEYETFGNATKMPSGDAGGHEIMSTYYVDNQVASEEQNKQLLDFKYDPMGRTMETASENKETKAKTNVISHYAGSGNALTWTSEGTEKWTRNIPGIDGTLSATQEAGKAPMLQLHDLEGNIVGAVEDNEAVTKLLSTYNSTEYGVPNEGKTPPKYAWLGAAGVSTETSFGSGAATQGGASYVPQVARALQTAPVVPPGAFPNGSPGTQFTAAPVTAGAIAGAQEIAAQFWQQAEAERQKAKEREATEALQKCREEGGCGELVDPECKVTVAVGATISSTGKEWVYARGWGECGGRPLPRYSELEVCLIIQLPAENFAPYSDADCSLRGAGFKPNGGEEGPGGGTLYGHDHVRCEGGVSYMGWAWFWIPGMSKGEEKYTNLKEPWQCGVSGESVTLEFAITIYESAPTV
jgi:DNA-binding beta-propeller fold protein YncE